jgi:hypothetical protein
MDAEEEDTEAWLRRNSTWKVRKVRRESKKSVDHVRGTSADRASGRRGIGTMARGDKGAGAGAAGPEGERGEERDVEEVGEGTGLLSEGKEREAKREKLAKVALNGTSSLPLASQDIGILPFATVGMGVTQAWSPGCAVV